MKSITVQIPDNDFESLGIKSSAIEFNELLRKIKQHELKTLFKKINRNAAVAGLDTMTEEEINNVIKEVRLEMQNG